MFGSHRSLHRSYCATHLCHDSPGRIRRCDYYKLAHYALPWRNTKSFKFCFVWSICFHIHRHKCGQIPCLKNGCKIQTSGKFKARSYSFNLFLAYWFFGCALALVLEPSHRLHNSCYFCCTFCGHLRVFYTKIYLRLQQHQTQVEHVHQGQPNRQGNLLIIAQYKKTVYSIAWVQLAMVVCYVPFIISTTIIPLTKEWTGVTLDIVWASAVTLLYFNSSLNPILYCWKITEVRQAVKGIVKQFCCWSS